MTRTPLVLVASTLLVFTAATGGFAAQKVTQGVTDGPKLSGGGGPTGQRSVGDFQIQHIDGFKGAKRVAISVFNVAFPDENSLTANMHAHNNIAVYHTSSTLHTTLQGVDPATRQRIADAAYAGFVDELTRAGFDVVPPDELARLAPEYKTWTSLPNFSKGRFGTYVAPTGRLVYFLQGDASKRDTSGKKGELFLPFRAFDRPQAMTRSPYLAHDANLGIIAVTLVIDYGVYSTTGETKKLHGQVQVSFDQGVAVQSGTLLDTATLAEYWGPKSGGFAAIAALAVPVISDLPFGEVTGGNGEVVVKADAAKFELAALEAARIGDAKLVGAIAAAR
jgi:hypothetical protein